MISSTQRIKVNFGDFSGGEHIEIRFSENIQEIPNFGIKQQKISVPEGATAEEIQEITTVFAMFSLIDELTNQIFSSMNDEKPKGFLGLDDIFRENPHGNKQKNNRVFDDAESNDEIPYNKRNDDFTTAHVEFIEGGASKNNEENQEKLTANIKNTVEEAEKEIINDLDSEKKGNDTNEENLDNGTVILTSVKKELIQKKEYSGWRKILVFGVAVVIALLIFWMLKQKMIKKLESNEQEGGINGFDKIHPQQNAERKGD